MLCEETGSKNKPSSPHRSKLFIEVKVVNKFLKLGNEIKAFLHDTSKAKFVKKLFFQIAYFNYIFCILVSSVYHVKV